MIAASDALSTSVTKSLCCFLLTLTKSRSSDARLMICPARRAALTAILSIGCIRQNPCDDRAMAVAGRRNTTRDGPLHWGKAMVERTEKERGAGSTGSRLGAQSRYSIREGLRLP